MIGIVSSKWSGSNPITRESDVEITGSLNVSNNVTATSFTGSFSGDGTNLIIDYNNAINTPPPTPPGGINGSIQFNDNNNFSGSTNLIWDNINNELFISGDTEITGSLEVQGSITSTNLSGSDDRVVLASPTGELQSSNQTIIQAYINPLGVAASLLDDTNNWDISGFYIGVAISGTFQGQRHYNVDYFFEAVDDNDWIRLIRG